MFLGLCGFLLALALTVDYHRVVDYMFSDEAVYYMMAQSIAYDYDLEYTQQDLWRVYKEEWRAGPQGVFLTKLENGKIYYSKSFVYALFLAPFIAIFGFNGFLVLNMLMLLMMIWMGWAYLRQFNSQHISLIISLTFFLLSASFIYTFWLTPETFNMFCITSGMFLWLYKREQREENPLLTRVSRFSKRSLVITILFAPFTFIKWLITSPEGRLYLAPIPIGIAGASKLPNILFIFPIVADILFESYTLIFRRKRSSSAGPSHAPLHQRSRIVWQCLRRFVIVCVLFWLIVGIFYGLQYVFSGHFNPYAGDRKTFHRDFPFASPNGWERGTRMSNDDYYKTQFYFHPKSFLYNIYYYVFGRFTGVLPYFFCALLALYYFVRNAFFPPASGRDGFSLPGRKILQRKECIQRIFVLLTIGASIFAYIYKAPSNYQGGGGAFGNRFFLNIYPAFLFLMTSITGIRPLLVTWIIGSLFLAQALINPFQTSYYPASQAFRLPYRLLPVELTLIDTIPTNVNRHLFKMMHEEDPPFRLHFTDENVFDISSSGFGVRGERTAEIAVRIYNPEPYAQLVITLRNGLIANQVDITAAGRRQSINLATPRETKRIVVPLTWSMPYFTSRLYPLKIRSHTGYVPKFTPGTAIADQRFLGCRVQVSLNPLKIGTAYLENGQFQKAVAMLEPIVREDPDNIHARYSLAVAYQQSAKLEAAAQELGQSLSLLPGFRERIIADCKSHGKECLATDEVSGAETVAHDLAKFLHPITRRYEAEEAVGFKLTKQSFDTLRNENIPDNILESLKTLENQEFLDEDHFLNAMKTHIEKEQAVRYKELISKHTEESSRFTGEVIQDPSRGEVVVFDPPRDPPGYLVYGQNADYLPGQYQAKFRMNIRKRDDMQVPSIGTAVFFEVYHNEFGIIKQQSVFLEPGNGTPSEEFRDYSLNFDLDHPATLQFRVKTTGLAQVAVDKIDVYPRLPLHIYQTFAQVNISGGSYDEALSYLEQIAAIDPWTPEYQQDFLHALIKAEKWPRVLDILTHSHNVSDSHTGIASVAFEDEKNVGPQIRQFLTGLATRFLPGIPVEQTFDDKIALLGYDLSTHVITAGDHFTIRYFWKSLKSIDEDYAIFVHFVKQDQLSGFESITKLKRLLRIPLTDMFQQDHQPLHGAYPTSRWLPNERIREEYDIMVPRELEPGTYGIWIGLWNPLTKERLQSDGKTKVKIGELQIKAIDN